MSIARPFWLLAVLLLAAPFARGEQYWVSYEGNDYPENEGWTRQYCDENGIFGQGGAIRTLEDGALVLDSLRSEMIVDYYEMRRLIDPEPGERFIMRWRLKVDSVPRNRDPGVGVFTDKQFAVAFEFSESELQSVFERDVHLEFNAHGFHTFELTSDDMIQYTLTVDGLESISGQFTSVVSASRIGWGDVIQGGASLSQWDYFEFGVVPEPSAAFCGLLLVLFVSRNRGTCNNGETA